MKATTILKGEIIAEEEFELPPKWKGTQRKLKEYFQRGGDD